MQPVFKKGTVLLLSVVLLFVSCAKETSCEDCFDGNATFTNTPPVANAGPDQTITIPEDKISLNGSNSTDPDGNITSYAWRTLSGPPLSTITNPTAAQTTVLNLVLGAYEFELQVKDSRGLFSRDTVSITVRANSANVTWKPLQILPEEDFELGSNHINFLLGVQDKVFGVSKNGSLWSYNPQKNEWVEKGDLPSYMASSNFSVVFSIANKGYLIGNGTCRQYNVATNGWTTKNNVPVGINHVDYSVPLVLGNKAYLVGSTNNLVTLYDATTDTYSAKNAFPDIGAAAGFVINQKAYCVQQEGRFWIYDPATDSWQKKAALPASIYNMSAFTVNGYGYIIGDLNREAFDGNGRLKVWQYNPLLDEWKELPENYPGKGVLAIKTASLNGVAYVGLGYDKRGVDIRDFWSVK